MGAKTEHLKPKDIPLNGRLILSVDPLLVGQNYRELKNFRYAPGGLAPVYGQTKVNTTALTSYPKMRNGFHYRKESPTESHILVQSFNDGETEYKLYDNTTAVPSAGDFSATALWTGLSGAGTLFPTNAPDSCVAMCDGKSALVWGGNEFRVGKFLVKVAAANLSFNFTEVVNNDLTDAQNVASLFVDASKVLTIYIGATRALKGVKFYVASGNASVTGTTALSYWSNATATWVAVGSLVDGTAAAGKPFAQTGSLTFTSTAGTANSRIMEQEHYFWYKLVCTLDAGASSTLATISRVTLDAPVQQAVDLWDGVDYPITKGLTYTAAVGHQTYTTNLLVEDYDENNTATYVQLGTFPAAPSTDGLLLGFPVPMTGVLLSLPGGKGNTNASTLTAYYWSSSGWTALSGVTDTTAISGASMAKGGMVTWAAPTPNTEFAHAEVAEEFPWFYYLLKWSAAFIADVRLDYAAGIPAPRTIKGYSYPLMWQNRLLLCDEKSGKRNSVLVGATGSVNTWNGGDSDEWEVGDSTPIVAGGSIFARFGSSLFDTLILVKENETWIVDGKNMEEYQRYRVGKSFGCVAPGTFRICDTGYEIAQGVTKHVAIWQSAAGIVLFDVNSLTLISSPDIESLFDQNSSDHVNATLLSTFMGDFDEERQEYHWYAKTGSSTTFNREFVYSLGDKKWFEVERDA